MSITLAELTTFQVGGKAGRYLPVDNTNDIDQALATITGELLILSGGSNLLVGQEGFPGTVLHMNTRGCEIVSDDGDAVVIRAQAGMPWDDFVYACLQEGLSGLEALSGIPGRAGATPIQNVGAYGAQVGETIAAVHVREQGPDSTWCSRTLTSEQLAFGYRTSVLKRRLAAHKVPFVVTSVDYRLRRSHMSAPIQYPELAQSLGVALGQPVSAAQVREHVLALRARKGMVLDPVDRDTCSAGSFFLNPLISPATVAALPAAAPRYPVGAERLKLSAAWLIENAGFGRGFGRELTGGRATLSTKHTLAITNRGGASAEDILTVARTVRAGVHACFGVVLEPEPVLIRCAL